MSAPHEDLTEEIGALFDEDGEINGTRANGRFASTSSESTDDDDEPTVTVGQCERWRRNIQRSSVTLTSLAESAGVDVTTVRYHVRDGCIHDVDAPRVTGDQR